jgi:microcystin-dependent protein
MAKNSVHVAGTITNSGRGILSNIRNPYEGINYIIALDGLYPPRNEN